MILNLITLSTVKTQLGINSTTYDAQISAMIPVVSSDVRRILNCNFDIRYVAAFDSSAATIDFGVTSNIFYNANYGVDLPFAVGQVVYHPNIAEDTYLTAYAPTTGLYTLSNTPTDLGDYIYPTVTIAQWPVISKMVWYKISSQNTTSVNEEKLSSYTIGPVSKTYADSEINSKYNYPQTLIDDLGVPFAKVG